MLALLGIIGALEGVDFPRPRNVQDFVLYGWGITCVLAPLVLRVQHLVVQLFGRAVLLQWSVFGCIIVASTWVNGHTSDVHIAGLWIGAGLVPLGIMGRSGLDSTSGAFTPNAFRNTLLASLLFGLADTWALLFYGLCLKATIAVFACAGLMFIALAGLYRLKVWGLALCVVANLIVAGCGLSGLLQLPDILTCGLVATAAIQLLLPIPLIKSMMGSSTGCADARGPQSR